jgi:hypothetical protein
MLNEINSLMNGFGFAFNELDNNPSNMFIFNRPFDDDLFFSNFNNRSNNQFNNTQYPEQRKRPTKFHDSKIYDV